MIRPKTFLLTALLAASLPCVLTAYAGDNPVATVVRPAGYMPKAGDAALGERLFNDTRLSSNGLSCASCHANNAAFSASFAQPYPHTVAMANERLGLKTIQLDEMIQACMVMPMATQPLPWRSAELAGLVAYVESLQKTFKPVH